MPADTMDWSVFDNWGSSFDVLELGAEDTGMTPASTQKTNHIFCKKSETFIPSQDTTLSEETEWSDEDGSSTTSNHTDIDCQGENWIWDDIMEKEQINNTQTLIQLPVQVSQRDSIRTSLANDNELLGYPVKDCVSDDTEDKVPQSEAFWEL
jgi:hypothetical protein